MTPVSNVPLQLLQTDKGALPSLSTQVPAVCPAGGFRQSVALLTGPKSSAARPELARGSVPVPSPALQASDC